MKSKFISFIAILLLAACNQNASTDYNTVADTKATVANTAAIPAGIVPNTVMTEDYVKSMSKVIYLWGWPLVNVHNRVTLLSEVKEPIYVGGVIPTAPI